MSSNNLTANVLKEEIDKVKAGLQEYKQLAYGSNESLNRRLNEFIERNNSRMTQLNSVIDLLIKENQELKNLLVNQRFVIQPLNPYQLGPNNQVVQVPGQNPNNQQPISIPFTEAFLSGNATLNSASEPTRLHTAQDQPQQQQSQTHTSSRSGNQQSSHPHSHHHSQSQNQQQHQHHQSQQSSHQQQSRPSQESQHQSHSHLQNQTQNNGNIDSSLAEATSNNGMLRFINNQYVEDETSLNQNGGNSQSASSRIDFVFMDPSASRGRHFRANSNTYQEGNQLGDDDDEVDEDGSPIDNLSPPQASSSSRLQKSTTRQSEYDAENYDLIIHNDFNKVEDIYYEYYNSLKPQVERVQKAYKIKKIRKYQKIKALAVRVDRYKELKGCSLAESFQFFDNLRIAEDNTKRSIAWLYNTLPDVLKKMGLEDQLKRSGTGA